MVYYLTAFYHCCTCDDVIPSCSKLVVAKVPLKGEGAYLLQAATELRPQMMNDAALVWLSQLLHCTSLDASWW